MIVTVLNGQEEEVVLQRLKKEARDKCKEEMERLVNCTRTKTFSMFWHCNQENQAAQSCLAKFTGQDTHHKMRMEELEKKKNYLKMNGLYPPE
jgi:oligoribonuclease NrnB/cAMP/cGMP phosphodiesterase (DHH superfamily)